MLFGMPTVTRPAKGHPIPLRQDDHSSGIYRKSIARVLDPSTSVACMDLEVGAAFLGWFCLPALRQVLERWRRG